MHLQICGSKVRHRLAVSHRSQARKRAPEQHQRGAQHRRAGSPQVGTTHNTAKHPAQGARAHKGASPIRQQCSRVTAKPTRTALTLKRRNSPSQIHPQTPAPSEAVTTKIKTITHIIYSPGLTKNHVNFPRTLWAARPRRPVPWELRLIPSLPLRRLTRKSTCSRWTVWAGPRTMLLPRMCAQAARLRASERVYNYTRDNASMHVPEPRPQRHHDNV